LNWAQNERLVDEGIGQFISGRNCSGLFAVAVLLTDAGRSGARPGFLQLKPGIGNNSSGVYSLHGILKYIRAYAEPHGSSGDSMILPAMP